MSKNNRYIRLYADEFDYDTWCQYCDIMDIDYDTTDVTVYFSKVIPYYDEEEDEDE